MVEKFGENFCDFPQNRLTHILTHNRIALSGQISIFQNTIATKSEKQRKFQNFWKEFFYDLRVSHSMFKPLLLQNKAGSIVCYEVIQRNIAENCVFFLRTFWPLKYKKKSRNLTISGLFMVAEAGLEPTTSGLWATASFYKISKNFCKLRKCVGISRLFYRINSNNSIHLQIN